jgi:predicted DNA-binding transcriptional regulator AlpA
MSASPLFWKRSEVLSAFRISAPTLRSLVRKGEFPKPVKIGRQLLWRAADLKPLLEPVSA